MREVSGDDDELRLQAREELAERFELLPAARAAHVEIGDVEDSPGHVALAHSLRVQRRRTPIRSQSMVEEGKPAPRFTLASDSGE